MAPSVDLQANIDTLGFGSLSSFRALLAAASADNVQPLAMEELEALGTKFIISGPLAKCVPDALQRCRSHRIETLSMMVGWRKHDTAHFLSQTAGGQAVALLCLCLVNLFSNETVGSVLHDLCDGLLSREWNVSSVKQLAEAAKVVGDKMTILDFNHVLALHVTRVRYAYLTMDQELPQELCQNIVRDVSKESIVAFLRLLSEALIHHQFQLKVSGMTGQGQLMACAMVLCPEDTLVTVENVTYHQGNRSSSVWIDVRSSEHLRLMSEMVLSRGETLDLPIRIHPRLPYPYETRSPSRIPWRGCLSRKLQALFFRIGIHFDKDLSLRFRETLLGLMRFIDEHNSQLKIYGGIRGLLGLDADERILRTIRTIFDLDEDEIVARPDRLGDFINNLASLLTEIEGRMGCTKFSCAREFMYCMGLSHFVSNEWNDQLKQPRVIWNHSTFWIEVAQALDDGIVSFFITAGDNTFLETKPREKPTLFTSLCDPTRDLSQHLEAIWDAVFRLMQPYRPIHNSTFPGSHIKQLIRDYSEHDSKGLLGVGNGYVAMYPSMINSLELPRNPKIEFILQEGNFFLKHKYFTTLKQASVSSRIAEPSLLQTPLVTSTPESIHEELVITVREAYDTLEVSTFVRTNNIFYEHNLHDSIRIAYGIRVSAPCACIRNAQVSTTGLPRIYVAPLAGSTIIYDTEGIMVIMAQGSRQAQFLACGKDINREDMLDFARRPKQQKLFQGPKTCLKCTILEASTSGPFCVVAT